MLKEQNVREVFYAEVRREESDSDSVRGSVARHGGKIKDVLQSAADEMCGSTKGQLGVYGQYSLVFYADEMSLDTSDNKEEFLLECNGDYDPEKEIDLSEDNSNCEYSKQVFDKIKLTYPKKARLPIWVQCQLILEKYYVHIIAGPPKGEKAERDHSGEPKDGESSTKHEEDFLGFSPSADKSKADVLISRADIAQANAMARQLHVFKPGIDFVPGSRLEVLESRDNNWYQCKIVEVDWGELDILVHYERWSNRFDEWLKMDSTRIRPMIRSSLRKDRRSSHFRVGDKVTARWAADGKRYHARITKSLGDDQYEVLFFDGVAKILRSGALTKVILLYSCK
ncbi:uncharacterized protein LOC121870425 [Homarus americanus]|uniref:uncharacterized protein LOC121870425 n=1 Tax=Homarus americanus TaxID=6706 RepID=UPI001C492698|nr:uncharacterized protein LOC121870425 [Homarus americanus]